MPDLEDLNSDLYKCSETTVLGIRNLSLRSEALGSRLLLWSNQGHTQSGVQRDHGSRKFHHVYFDPHQCSVFNVALNDSKQSQCALVGREEALGPR